MLSTFIAMFILGVDFQLWVMEVIYEKELRCYIMHVAAVSYELQSQLHRMWWG